VHSQLGRSDHTGLARADATPVTFDSTGLTALRHALAGQVAACGLAGQARDDFVLAVNEVAVNAVVHGGGTGQLLLWCDAQRLRCEISDSGRGLAADLVPSTPATTAESGRGLWLASQLCGLEIATGPEGTTVGIAVQTTQAAGLIRSGVLPGRHA
jgi:anti-sigma regulatory factor (Ser/Thr protein kinase)